MIKRILIVYFLVTVSVACGPKRDSESSNKASAFALERENFFNSLKNPEEVATSLSTGVTEFDSTVLNNPTYFYRYTSNSIIAAANLGIYLADLNYCILYKEPEQAKRYFQATYELSKAIQIERGILEFLMKRYQSNLERNDSVKLIVNQLFSQATLGLQNTDRERLAGIAMAGYQVETLHLALITLKTFPEVLTESQSQAKEQLIQFVLAQRGKFEVVYNFVRANSDPLDPDNNPNYPFFDNALRELIGVYHTVTEGDPHLKELGEKISVIRSKIINEK